MDSHVTITIFADNRLTREGLERIFERTEFRIAGSVGSFEALDAELENGEGCPGLLLIAVDERHHDLAQQIERLCHRKNDKNDMRLVLLMGGMNVSLMARLFEAGVDGFVLTDISSEALVASLKLILAGERVFPSQLVPLIMRGAASLLPISCRQEEGSPNLSERELQILRCLVDGNPNKVIANRLEMAEATIKVHVKNILRKLQAENRTQAAIWALHHGIDTNASERKQAS